MVLRDATGLPVKVAPDALTCVALGTGIAMENLKTMRGVLSTVY
jgi:rod shape-determining protein MreB